MAEHTRLRGLGELVYLLLRTDVYPYTFGAYRSAWAWILALLVCAAALPADRGLETSRFSGVFKTFWDALRSDEYTLGRLDECLIRLCAVGTLCTLSARRLTFELAATPQLAATCREVRG